MYVCIHTIYNIHTFYIYIILFRYYIYIFNCGAPPCGSLTCDQNGETVEINWRLSGLEMTYNIVVDV